MALDKREGNVNSRHYNDAVSLPLLFFAVLHLAIDHCEGTMAGMLGLFH